MDAFTAILEVERKWIRELHQDRDRWSAVAEAFQQKLVDLTTRRFGGFLGWLRGHRGRIRRSLREKKQADEICHLWRVSCRQLTRRESAVTSVRHISIVSGPDRIVRKVPSSSTMWMVL